MHAPAPTNHPVPRPARSARQRGALCSAALAALLMGSPLQAQQPGHGGHHGAHHTPAQPAGAAHGSAGPYAGLQTRAIKALSNEQIADLRAGKGMALALPAELNGYPGPMHVLELAEPLALSAAQRERTAALLAAMQSEARAAGEQLIEAERALDDLFKSRTVTPARLDEATAAAGQAQARLRAVHLRHHIGMVALLSAEQVARYQRLRGY